MAGSKSFFLALILALPAAARQTTQDDCKPIKIVAALQDSPTHYQAQLLGDLDRPVGEGVKLKTADLPATVNDKGNFELDVHNDGKTRTLSGKREIVAVTVSNDADKPKTLKLEFRKREDGAWVYRNLTTLHVMIGTEQFVIVDVSGNGAYNDPRSDGMTWEGKTWLYPLPSEAERWCSATMEFTGLTMGPLGEDAQVRGKPLATTVPAALPVLKGVNEERVEIGLTPRPEDEKLSADLQKHCKYMEMNKTLTHPEDKGKPGYTDEGNKAGMRSILGQGSSPDRIAENMVGTYFHRQDMLRPGTLAFGVGVEGAFTGIDGRSSMTKVPERAWPVLCPLPGQSGVATNYGKEAPDATPGDNSAGYPIT